MSAANAGGGRRWLTSRRPRWQCAACLPYQSERTVAPPAAMRLRRAHRAVRESYLSSICGPPSLDSRKFQISGSWPFFVDWRALRPHPLFTGTDPLAGRV